MKKRYVLISLVTNNQVTKEPHGKDIMALFYERYPSLAPQYANFNEPINKPTSTVDVAIAYWEGDPALYRRKNTVAGRWHISTDFTKKGYLVFEYDWNEKIDWAILFQKLVTLTAAYFGYVHVFTDREIEPASVGSAIFAFLRGTAGHSLKKGIPQLAWGNYFGEEYVKELDIPLIKKHGFFIESLGNGHVLNVTDKLSDVITNYDEFNERRKLLKSLFRPTLFQNYARYEHES